MDANRWHRVQELFEAASPLTASARGAFLDAECRDDTDLREQVESLLGAAGHADRFIETAVDRARAQLSRFTAGTRVGPYQIDRELGRGGMGAVYLAHRADDQYQAQVAIKLIAGTAASPDVVRRFKTERQILANLHHPNIAQLLDGGATEDGLPYLVMEYVDGERIDAYCDRLALPVRRRIELFLAVCAAVEHAHRNLVVHRDLKPANILVTADGDPKLLDFGIAKVVQQGAGEETGTLRFMTPIFASPEQVRGQVITTASDEYSLAVVLFELLTGRPPYAVRGLSPLEVARVICDIEPTLPSDAILQPAETSDGPTPAARAATRSASPERLRRVLVGDLDIILLTALRKEPARRYPSVEQFSQDLRRYLDARPVLARKDTLHYRAGKFVRRHRVGVATTVATVAALTGVVTFAMGRVAHERDRARLEAARAAQVATFLTDVFRIADPSEARGREVTARELLARGAQRIETELAGQPAVQATMLAAVGTVYEGLGLYQEAAPLLERARTLAGEHAAADPLALAKIEQQLGILLTRRAEYVRADSVLGVALMRLRAHPRASRTELVRTLDARGVVARERARFEDAEQYFQEALTTARALGDSEPGLLATVLGHVGDMLRARADGRAAEQRWREALAIRRRGGPNDPGLPEALAGLGNSLTWQGRYPEAEVALREAVAVGRRIFGDDHPSVASYLSNLADAVSRIGHLAEAESLQTLVLAIHEKRLGDQHPTVAQDMMLLADTRADRGNLSGSVDMLRQAVALLRKSLGEEHPAVTGAIGDLGSALGNNGEFVEGLRYSREAMDRYRRAFGEDDPRYLQQLNNVASSLIDLGRLEQAEPMLRDALARSLRVLGAADVTTVLAQGNLARVLVRTRRPAEAEPLIRDALAVGARVFPLHWYMGAGRGILGEVHMGLGRYPEAEQELQAGCAILRDKRPARDHYRRYWCERLAALYRAWGKPDGAAVAR